MKQQSVESGNEEIGSSLQRIASNLSRNEEEATTMGFPPDLLHVVQCDHSNERWKLNRISQGMRPKLHLVILQI
jgi:hypothetical protein